MGGAVSVDDGSMILVEDHAIAIKPHFIQTLSPAMNLDVTNPVITASDELLIQSHWAKICNGTAAFDPAKHITPMKFFSSTFYSLLFEAAPSVRPLFRSSITVQGKSLARLIDVLVTIVKANDIERACLDLAARHAAFGATNDHYSAVGTILLKTLEVVSGPEWSEKLHTAYLTAYCFLYYLMLPNIIDIVPVPIKLSLPGSIVKRDMVSPEVVSLSVSVDFPIRYHPGDSILLGLPLPTGEIRRSYAVTSLYTPGVNLFDICVQAAGEASTWLCQANVGTAVNVYWINVGVHIETDEPAAIPKKPLFVSEGIAVAPFYTMMRALQSIQDQWDGSAVALQCGKLSLPCFETIEWSRCTIATASVVTMERMLELAPDLSERHLYVAGSAAFVEETKRFFRDGGGQDSAIEIYSFDNEAFVAASQLA
ncbi:hypothetical protein ACHHYP_04800 [Achlya hypogyna]|uniref:nitric oxide dioxygenase n=1 Tax=Achlya hypogyna TaxID=1202772 RepID=A0A1V9Z097_ACHHY|nr:hypothetical protein ACHHYP_04800 [Achlya hypogyna]